MVLGLKNQRSRLGLGLEYSAIRRIAVLGVFALYECLLVHFWSMTVTSRQPRFDLPVSHSLAYVCCGACRCDRWKYSTLDNNCYSHKFRLGNSYFQVIIKHWPYNLTLLGSNTVGSNIQITIDAGPLGTPQRTHVFVQCHLVEGVTARDGATRLSIVATFFALFDPTIFWPNINWWTRYRDGLSLCHVWRF